MKKIHNTVKEMYKLINDLDEVYTYRRILPSKYSLLAGVVAGMGVGLLSLFGPQPHTKPSL